MDLAQLAERPLCSYPHNYNLAEGQDFDYPSLQTLFKYMHRSDSLVIQSDLSPDVV